MPSLGRYAFLAVVLCSEIARAQGSASAPAGDSKEEARQHFERGVQLFERDAWDDALTEFRRSRDLRPTRAAIINAALCLRNLGRFDEALETLEALPQQFPPQSEQDRQEYLEAILKLSKLVGALDLRTVEVGSQVWIDGRDRGRAPFAAPIRVSSGAHRVRVMKEGLTPFEETFEVRAGETAIVYVKRQVDPQALPVALRPERTPPASASSPAVTPARAPLRARFALSVEVGLPLAPSLGGDVAGCDAPCSPAMGVGGRVMGHATWGLTAAPTPWSLSVDVGYLGLAQSVDGRASSVMAAGLRDPGSVADTLHLNALLAGGSVGFHIGALDLHLGGGAALGSVFDDRQGIFATTPRARHAEIDEYSVSEAQRRIASYLYLSAGIAAGFQYVPGWWLFGGLDVTPLVALHQPQWDRSRRFQGPSGESSFAADSLMGSVVVLVTPQVGVRCEL